MAPLAGPAASAMSASRLLDMPFCRGSPYMAMKPGEGTQKGQSDRLRCQHRRCGSRRSSPDTHTHTHTHTPSARTARVAPPRRTTMTTVTMTTVTRNKYVMCCG
eukprot:COSAG01_NODE_2227_length_8132_cov_3.231420_9_plen_104_part_00